MTGGEKGNLPVNQGLTVCWSVEATSVRWLAINERTWAETISWDRRSSIEVRITKGMAIKRTSAAAANGASAPGQPHAETQRHDQRGGSALLCWRTAERNFFSNPFGA